MPRKLPKNVYSEMNRHGRRVYYFRKGHGLRIRLPNSIGSAEFNRAAKLAEESGISIPQPPIIRPSFERTQRQRVGRTLEGALQGAKQRAAIRGLPFDLDLAWALETVEDQGFKCPLSSIPFFMECAVATNTHPFSPSLDRIEPSKGYVRGNVRIVIFAINMMLLDWGTEVFERVISGYRYTKGTKSRTSMPGRDHPVRAVVVISQ